MLIEKMENKIRIAVVDDHTLFRKGMASILEQVEDFEVVLDAVNGRDFLDKLLFVLFFCESLEELISFWEKILQQLKKLLLSEVLHLFAFQKVD